VFAFDVRVLSANQANVLRLSRILVIDPLLDQLVEMDVVRPRTATTEMVVVEMVVVKSTMAVARSTSDATDQPTKTEVHAIVPLILTFDPVTPNIRVL
jgi:hypothetical protein